MKPRGLLSCPRTHAGTYQNFRAYYTIKNMTKRAIRRHHYRRLKKYRSTYWGGGHTNPRHQGLKVSTPKLTSSCECCTNQRPIDGETRQEKRSRLNFEDSTNDYFSNLLWADDWADEGLAYEE